jgi:hypothetical protein
MPIRSKERHRTDVSAGYARRCWARTTESFQHRVWCSVSQLRMRPIATFWSQGWWLVLCRWLLGSTCLSTHRQTPNRLNSILNARSSKQTALWRDLRQGDPLVLIHGGLMTIGEMQGWAQPLAKTRRVIAVEIQGHCRTADTDRPMSFATMGVSEWLTPRKSDCRTLVGGYLFQQFKAHTSGCTALRVIHWIRPGSDFHESRSEDSHG